MKELFDEYSVRRLVSDQASFYIKRILRQCGISSGSDRLKDLSNVKGTLKGWTETSAEWYESASEYTGYHDHLLKALLPFLRPEDQCCEIACGTGILARKTAPHVASYTANDADGTAVSFLKKQIQNSKGSALEVLEGAWQTVLENRKFDVILASYYGVPVKYWPFLTSVVSRSFIAICPRNPKWRKIRHREDEVGKEEATIRKLETPEHIKKFFSIHGIPFESLPLDLEFGQPFRDRTEAQAYVRYYYRLDGADAEQFIDEKTVLRDGILFFPKKKEIEIIAADLSRT